MDEIKTKNHKFLPDSEGNCSSRKATKNEIAKGRAKLKKTHANGWSFRSCYECNGAHAHLMREGVIIQCFGCGRWFVDGVDVMDYTS